MWRAIWKNALYILDHKVSVLVECWQEGLYFQGIFHDLSKFSPKEFFPYAKKFFSDKQLNETDELRWSYAWLNHQHKNKHHWEYWVVDPDKKLAVPMPRKYLLEMICDRRSLSRKWGKRVKPATIVFSDKIILHPETRKDLEFFLMNGSVKD